MTYPEFIGDDTDIVRRRIQFETPFTIDGFLQGNAAQYLATRISIAAYIGNLAATNDGTFVCAVDEVEGSLTDKGTLQVRAAIAERDDDDVELTMVFQYSAWVLTYEPRAEEFPIRHERLWSLEQAARIHDHVSPGRPSDHDRVTTVRDAGHAGGGAARMRLDQHLADRVVRRAREASAREGGLKSDA
jgi:hypothetical protein